MDKEQEIEQLKAALQEALATITQLTHHVQEAEQNRLVFVNHDARCSPGGCIDEGHEEIAQFIRGYVSHTTTPLYYAVPITIRKKRCKRCIFI